MEENASTSSSSSSSNESIRIIRQSGKGMKMENPFTLKVGQVFTGFGVGCGLGIGVGRPLNLGAIPVLNQVMTAASGATHAFSGVARHVNSSLRKIGAKNIEAGIGCGVGFGHGFGIGLALKPGVVPRIQWQIMEAMTKLMMKFGAGPKLSIGQGALPESLQRGMSVVRGSSQNSLGSITQFGKNIPDMMKSSTAGDTKINTRISSSASDGEPLNLSFGTRSEKLINSFLKDPVLKGDDTTLPLKDGKLQSENEVLRMVLKHQHVIEELIKENEMLRQILVEDLKVPSSKLQTTSAGKLRSPCSDCFECRRKERRK